MNFKKPLLLLSTVLALAFQISAQTRRPLKLDDLTRFRNVGDPQCSPDGNSVAYTVSTIDAKDDKSSTHIWMIGFDGRNDRQITFSSDSEGSPRWSPDGKYLSFTSGRSSGKPGVRGSQIWLLDRSGGEAYQLTEFKGRLQGYEWSPDSKRIAVLIGDPDPDAPTQARRRRPAHRRSHLSPSSSIVITTNRTCRDICYQAVTPMYISLTWRRRSWTD